MRSAEPDVTVTVCPDGPLLLRGPWRLRTVDGQTVEPGREVTALCRCGRSRIKPLCDGSHKASRFSDDADAAAVAHVIERTSPLIDRKRDPA